MKEVGGTRNGLINSILEFYMYVDDVTIKYGDKEVTIRYILKKS